LRYHKNKKKPGWHFGSRICSLKAFINVNRRWKRIIDIGQHDNDFFNTAGLDLKAFNNITFQIQTTIKASVTE
jgi:hypothetical protein